MGSHFFSNYNDLKPFSWSNLQGNYSGAYKNPGIQSSYTGTGPSLGGANSGYGAPLPSYLPQVAPAAPAAGAAPQPGTNALGTMFAQPGRSGASGGMR